MNLKRISKLLLSSVMACALLLACDKQEAKSEKKADEPTAADKELQDRLAKKRADREAKEKEAQDEMDKIKALAALPEEMPADIDAACTAAGEARDGFMQKILKESALEQWNGAKAEQLKMHKDMCLKGNNIKVAACQAKALTDAGEELAKKLTEIVDACGEKFGGEGGGGGEAKPG